MPLLSDSAMCSKPPDLALGQEKLFSFGSGDVRAFGPWGSAWPVMLLHKHLELRQTDDQRVSPSLPISIIPAVFFSMRPSHWLWLRIKSESESSAGPP